MMNIMREQFAEKFVIINRNFGKSFVDLFGGGKAEVELFRDSKDYKDDVFVAVNGKGIQIKRGVRVKIPKSYKKVLNRGQRQDTAAARISDEKQDEFYEETQRI